MPRGSSAISWLAWMAPVLTVALAILLSLLGSELVRLNAVRQLDALRSAHWTEQARVFTQTNNVLRLFRLYLVTLTATLAGDQGLWPVDDVTPARTRSAR